MILETRRLHGKILKAQRPAFEVPFHNDQPTQGEVRWSQTYCRDPDFVGHRSETMAKLCSEFSLIFECVTGKCEVLTKYQVRGRSTTWPRQVTKVLVSCWPRCEDLVRGDPTFCSVCTCFATPENAHSSEKYGFGHTVPIGFQW